MRGQSEKAARSSVSRQLFPSSQWPPDATRAPSSTIDSQLFFFSLFYFVPCFVAFLVPFSDLSTQLTRFILFFSIDFCFIRFEEAKELCCCFLASATTREVKLELLATFSKGRHDEKTTDAIRRTLNAREKSRPVADASVGSFSRPRAHARGDKVRWSKKPRIGSPAVRKERKKERKKEKIKEKEKDEATRNEKSRKNSRIQLASGEG